MTSFSVIDIFLFILSDKYFSCLFSDKYFLAGVKLGLDVDHRPGGGDKTERVEGGVPGPESKQDPVMMSWCFVCFAQGEIKVFSSFLNSYFKV